MKRLLLLLPIVACLFFSFAPAKKITRVVFFGDSITEFGLLPGGYITQMRDSLVAKKLDKDFELIGAGVSGNKIYDLYLRLETDVLAQKPKIVVVYVGVNEVWHKQTLGTGTDADKFQKFYRALIARLQKEKIQVILCTPACIGEKKGGANPLDADLNAYSQMIRDLAKNNGCLLTDFRQAFTSYDADNNDTDRYSSLLTTDGVHLNQKGNKMVAEMLLKQLQAVLPAK